MDGVGYGGACASDADFPDAAGAHRGVRIGDIGPEDVDFRDVHVDGHVILGERRVHDAALALVPLSLFHEGEAEAHDHTAPKL